MHVSLPHTQKVASYLHNFALHFDKDQCFKQCWRMEHDRVESVVQNVHIKLFRFTLQLVSLDSLQPFWSLWPWPSESWKNFATTKQLQNISYYVGKELKQTHSQSQGLILRRPRSQLLCLRLSLTSLFASVWITTRTHGGIEICILLSSLLYIPL